MKKTDFQEFQNGIQVGKCGYQFGKSATVDLVLLGFGHKLISQSAHSDQVFWLGRIFFNIAAQAPMKLSMAGVYPYVFFQVPDLFQDFFARTGRPLLRMR